MENEDTVRGIVDGDEVEIARYVREHDIFQGKHLTGKIYVPSEQSASAAQVGSAEEKLDEIPYLDGIPPAQTSDSDNETGADAIFRSPLTALPVNNDSKEEEEAPRLIPVAADAKADRSPALSSPFQATAIPAVHEESVVGRSYMPASEAAQSLLPDGSITRFQPPLFRLPPSSIPLAPQLQQNPYTVMPPSRIPVPGTEQFIFLGGVVNSQFTEIMCDADVRTRVQRFGALVINAYQTEPRSEETLQHEGLRYQVSKLQTVQLAADLPEINYHHVDLRDFFGAPINDHIFNTALLIDEALANNKQVFVYCGKGVSRSATLVLGYLILAKNMTNDEANEYVCQQRAVAPNIGFSIALIDLARYNSDIGSHAEAITLAEKIPAIQAMIKAKQERTRVEQERSRAEEPASPVSPSAIAVPPPVQQPLRVGSYDGGCCGSRHSFREEYIEPGTNPHSASMGSAPRSGSYRANGSHPAFDPVFDDGRPGDEQPDYCFAHSVSKMHRLHQPASVFAQHLDGPLAPLPGSEEAEEPKSSLSPTA